MSQTIIKARIVDQAVQLANETLLASGSQGVLQISCEFDSSWNGYGKTAVFYRDPAVVFHVPMASGIATVPHEVLAEAGLFYFGVFGVAENTRTTEVVRLIVDQGAITVATAETTAPTPHIYSQIMAAFGQLDTRLNELVAMRGNGVTEQSIQGDYFRGMIYSNGAAAFISLEFYDLPLAAGAERTDYCILPAFAPLGQVTLNALPGAPQAVATITPRSWSGTEWAGITISNPTGADITTAVEFEGFYDLESVFIPELADLRVDASGFGHATAGEAVRAQIQSIAKSAMSFHEKGAIVKCTPVEGQPLEVITRIEQKNLFDISKVPLTEATGGAPYIAEVTENSIKVVTGEGYTGNGYVGTAKLFREFCPGLEVGDTFTISGTTESKSKYIYLADDFGAALNFGQSYTATEAMLNSKVVFYGLHNGTTGNQGVGTCTISNIQIERGTTATAYEPHVFYEELELHHTGKNLLPYPYCNTTMHNQGMNFTDNGDGSLTLNGTTTHPWTSFKFHESANLGEIKLFDGVTYYLSLGQCPSEIQFIFVYTNEQGGTVYHNCKNPIKWNDKYTITHCYAQISNAGVTFDNVTLYPQIEIGGAPTAFEPYWGDTYNITFPWPNDGGSYNWATGEFAGLNGDGGILNEFPQPIVPAEISGFRGTSILWSSAGETEVKGYADPTAVIADLYEKINQLQAAAVNNA